jgi:hypothetical protein
MRKMSVSRFLLIAAIAALVLMISACAFVAPPPQALTLDALKNAEYNSDLPAAKKAKLTNGVYEEEIVPGSASKLTIRLRDQYATGDLNGDGVADAAVVLAGNSGGSGVFVTLDSQEFPSTTLPSSPLGSSRALQTKLHPILSTS